MKFSKYNLHLENYPSKEYTLIYNTLTKASAVLSEDLKNLVKNTCSKLSEEDKRYISELKSLGIILDDEIDENLLMNYWYNKTRFSKLVLNGVIVPTTDCDLACTYCYQEGAKTHYYMDKDIQKKVVEWYKDKIEKDRPKQIFWAFFGGEPLLQIDTINYTTSSLKKYSDKKGVIFQFSIITNGTRLNKKDVKFWNKQGLVSIQITIDGTEKMHNKRRPFLSGNGSFKTIFNNLKEIAPLTSVILRMNIDSQNVEDVPKFLDFLCKENLKDNITIFYGLLLEADISLPHQKRWKMKDREGARTILKLREEAIKRGFKVSEILEGGPCIAKSEASVMIDPRGKIFKCTGHVGLENFSLGEISNCKVSPSRCQRDVLGEFSLGNLEELSEQEYEQKYSQYVGLQLDKECLECVFAPICLGGCPYKSWTKYKDPRKKICEKNYYQTIALDVLKQMYREEEIKEKLKKK